MKKTKELEEVLITGSSSAVYLHSPPGTGKGIIGSEIFRSRRLDPGIVCYYSFSARDTRRSTAISLFASIVHQVLTSDPSLFDIVQDMYETIKEQSLWTSHALWAMIKSLLTSRRMTSLLCIVNGIHHWNSLRGKYLERIVKGLKNDWFPIPIKFVFIGEFWGNLEILLGPHSTAELTDPELVSTWIRKRTDELLMRLFEKKPTLATEQWRTAIVEKLLTCQNLTQLFITVGVLDRGMRSGIVYDETSETKSGGKEPTTAEIPVNIIEPHDQPNRIYTARILQSELNLMPYDIPDLVTAVVRSLPSWAFKALGWILYAQRPMNTAELTIALSLVECEDVVKINTDEQFIDLRGALEDVFGPLLEFNGHVVALRHELVKDGFQQAIDRTVKHTPNSIRMELVDNYHITGILLKFLSSVDLSTHVIADLSQKRWKTCREPLVKFAAYVILFWPAHFQEAAKDGIPEDDLDGLLKLFSESSAIETWHELYGKLGGKDLRSDVCTKDPLFIASQLGLEGLVTTYLPHRGEEEKAEAVLNASWAGHTRIVQLIMDTYDIQTQSLSDKSSDTLQGAMLEASRRGHEDVVRLLLSYHKLNISNIRSSPKLLCTVAELGYSSLVRRFVTTEAPVNATYNGSSPLQLASKNGHEGIVNFLLDNGAEVNAKDAENVRKPILYAAAKGFKTMTEKLLSYGANPYQLDPEARTILHLAVQNGHLGVVQLLLDNNQAPQKLDDKDKNGRIALHLAAQNGHAEITRKLVQIWKDGVDDTDNDGYTSLRLASEAGHDLVVKILLESNAKIDTIGADGHSPLYSAVLRGSKAIASSILQKTDQNTRFQDIEDLLLEAARRGFTEVCKFCIRRLHDQEGLNRPDGKGKTALHLAVLGEYDEIVTPLLENGSNIEAVDENSQTALASAAHRGKWTSLPILLQWMHDHETEDHETKQAALLRELAELPVPSDVLTMSDHVQTIRTLLKYTSPNIPDPDRRKTALHLAAQEGKTEVIRVLLDSGADASIKAISFGWTPIFYAVRYVHIEATQLLFNHSRNPFVVDDDGWTPLHLAALNGAVEIMKIFVNADRGTLEFQTDDKSTALHYAIEYLDAVRWLLEQEVDVNAQNNDGFTALMLAANGNHDSVVKEILKHEPDLGILDASGNNILHREIERSGTISDFNILGHLLTSSKGDRPIVNSRNRKRRTPLHIAIDPPSGEPSIWLVNYLLDKQWSIDPNLQDNEGDSPLLLAVKAERYNIVESLLLFGVDTEIRNESGETALVVAVKGGLEKIWKLLLETKGGSDINSGDEQHPTILHILAHEGELDVIKTLVESYKARVDAIGGLYHTPLQAAAFGGFEEVVTYLLDTEADPKQTGGVFGHTLTAAAYSGLTSCITRLLKKDISVDYQDTQGRTALHMAAWRGDEENFQLLKKRGSILLKDSQGRSVMHHAAAGGSIDMIRKLLQEPEIARLNTVDIDGWLPLHWACRYAQNDKTVAILTENDPDHWPDTETKDGWTPRRIADFHDASELLPDDDLQGVSVEQMGFCHWSITCDGCQQEPIYGERWNCTVCKRFDFCFKCARTRMKTHFPHEFRKIDPTAGPSVESKEEGEKIQEEETQDKESSERIEAVDSGESLN
ncbi:hypothetical protein Hte_007853 [Hypoxylon texense]